MEQLDYWDVFLRLCDWALQGFEANCSAWRRRWEGSILMLKTVSCLAGNSGKTCGSPSLQSHWEATQLCDAFLRSHPLPMMREFPCIARHAFKQLVGQQRTHEVPISP